MKQNFSLTMTLWDARDFIRCREWALEERNAGNPQGARSYGAKARRAWARLQKSRKPLDRALNANPRLP